MILLTMIFLSFIDDFVLQIAILNKLKVKQWWIDNTKDMSSEHQVLYRYDYIVGLLVHGFMWTFLMMLPVAYVYHFELNTLFIIYFVGNMLLHAWIDHCKANGKTMSLIHDQFNHIIQIVMTWLMLIFV